MDSKEFKEIFMPYYKTLYRVAFHLTGGPVDAEDLLQDMYLKLWKNRDTLPPEARKEAYLVRMMQNLYYEQMRLGKIDVLVPIEDVQPPDDEDVELQIENKEQIEQLHNLIEELPPKEKQIATLYYIKQKTYPEIQDETLLNADNIRQLLHRAKTKLAQQLKDINNHEGHKS